MLQPIVDMIDSHSPLFHLAGTGMNSRCLKVLEKKKQTHKMQYLNDALLLLT